MIAKALNRRVNRLPYRGNGAGVNEKYGYLQTR
jgi:hypothetical protein